MTVNLDETRSFDTPAVAPTTGDIAGFAILRTLLQNIIRRSSYLKGLLDDGVPRIRHGNLAAMGAVTGAVSGDVFLVEGGGIFQFIPGSVATNAPIQYSGVGGSWFSSIWGILNITGGLAQRIGGSGFDKVAAAYVENGFTKLFAPGFSGAHTVTATSWTDVTTHAAFTSQCPGVASSSGTWWDFFINLPQVQCDQEGAQLRAVLNNGSGDYSPSITTPHTVPKRASATDYTTLHIAHLMAPTMVGTACSVRLQAKVQSGATLTIGDIVIRGKTIDP